MTTTQNYSLQKPDGTDAVDINVLNNNADIIDAKIKMVMDKADVAFQQADSGKLTIATAIGTPATKGDTYNVLASYITGFKTDISNKQVTINSLNTQVNNLTTDNTSKQSTINNLNSQVSSLNGQVSSLTTDNTNKQGTIDGLNTQITSGQNSIYTAIVNKGTTPSAKDFNSLATAIGNINTGKKVEIGCFDLTFTGNETNHKITKFTSLPFTPSIVVASDSDRIMASVAAPAYEYAGVNLKSSTLGLNMTTGGATEPYTNITATVVTNGFNVTYANELNNGGTLAATRTVSYIAIQ